MTNYETIKKQAWTDVVAELDQLALATDLQPTEDVGALTGLFSNSFTTLNQTTFTDHELLLVLIQEQGLLDVDGGLVRDAILEALKLKLLEDLQPAALGKAKEIGLFVDEGSEVDLPPRL